MKHDGVDSSALPGCDVRTGDLHAPIGSSTLEETIYTVEKSSAQSSKRIYAVEEWICTPEKSADAVEKSIYTPEGRADRLEKPADAGEEPIYTVEERAGTPEKWIVGLEKSSVALEESANRRVGDQQETVRPMDLIPTIESIVKIGAIFLGGWWTWIGFIRKRVTYPGAH